MFRYITIGFILAFQVATIMASTTEKQKFNLVHSEKQFEIRYYPSSAMATVYLSANEYKQISTPGFRTLAGFIFGGNNANTKIAMTSPVHMNINDSLSSMSFVMPSEYDIEELPTPTNSKVKLESSPAEYVAAIKFGGYASDASIRRHSEKLASLLDEKGISHQGNFRYLGYNPPYQLLGRKNEIIVTVNWND